MFALAHLCPYTCTTLRLCIALNLCSYTCLRLHLTLNCTCQIQTSCNAYSDPTFASMPSDSKTCVSCFASAVPQTYVVVIVWAAGRPTTGRRLADHFRLVEVGRRVLDSSTRGAADDSEPIGIDPRLSSALSTLALGHAKLGTDANTFCFASVVGSAVRTSL